MSRRTWVRLDNASNIFLAARNDDDSKVFRLAAEMDEAVDPLVLQQALEETFDRYPLYHAVLRRGMFWYYLQDSDLRPRVAREQLPTCAPLYQFDRRNLLFRVVHHRRRISLEVFHALSDGTGALWFLTDLLTAYCTLEAPHLPIDENLQTTTSGAAPSPHPRGERGEPADAAADGPLGLSMDSFTHYFRRHRPQPAPESIEAFRQAAVPAPLAIPALGPSRELPSQPRLRGRPCTTRRVHRANGMHRIDRMHRINRVYRVKGNRTPDDRPRAVDLTMSTSDVLALARAEGVALTVFLTALFFDSVRRSSPRFPAGGVLAASIPVNLRQFFPSTSPRNFFATIRVEHTYGQGDDSLGSVCQHLDRQFQPAATPQALEAKLRRLVRFERMVALRIVPRPLKDLILKLVNWSTNRGLSVALSNLGRVTLPGPADSRVGLMLFQVSAARPQLCAVSHAGRLTISFTSPFLETAHIREFARRLTSFGVAVSVAATRVTETELSDAAESPEEPGFGPARPAR